MAREECLETEFGLYQADAYMISGSTLSLKYAEIAEKLPTLVEEAPDSFACGHAMGYKQALLDIERMCSISLDLDMSKKGENFDT